MATIQRKPYYTLEQFVADLEKVDPSIKTDLVIYRYWNISFTEDQYDPLCVGKDGKWNGIRLSTGSSQLVGDLMTQLKELVKINPKAAVVKAGNVVSGISVDVTTSDDRLNEITLNTTVDPKAIVSEANEKKIGTLVDFVKLVETLSTIKLNKSFYFIGGVWYYGQHAVHEAYPTLFEYPTRRDLFTQYAYSLCTVELCRLDKDTMVKEFGPIDSNAKDLRIKELLKELPYTDENGRIVKKMISTTNGLHIQRSLPNGKLDGPQESFFDNGKPMSLLTYKNGVKEGLSMEYNRNGTMIGKATYKNNIREGVVEYYDEKGDLTERATFKNNLLDGPYESCVNGKPLMQGAYTKGRRNGPFKSFYMNGQMSIYREYKDDSCEGIEEHFNEEGNLTCRYECSGDKRIYQLFPLNLKPTKVTNQFSINETPLVVEKLSTGILLLVGRTDGHELKQEDRNLAKKFDIKLLECTN